MRALVLAMLAIAGCGDQLAGSDAGVVDGHDDAGLVRLRYLVDEPDHGGSHAVYFQNADGSLVSATRTQADGTTNAFMTAGGYVTLVAPFQGTLRAWTYADVKPGDQLELDLRTLSFAPLFATIDLTIPVHPMAAFYQLSTACGPAGIQGAEHGPVAVNVPICDTRSDLLILARNSSGAMVGSLLRAGIAVAPPYELALEGDYLEPTMSTVTALDIPPSLALLSATHGTVGRRELLYTQQLQYQLPSSAGSLTFTLPQGKTGTIVDAIEGGPEVPSFRVFDWRGANEHTVIDLAVRIPRRLGAPWFDLVAHAVTWTEEASGTSPDTVVASVVFLQPTGELAEWQIIAPRTGPPTVRFPAVPDRRLELGSTSEPRPTMLINAVVEGGYDRARELVLGRLPNRAWPMEGPEGHAAVQISTF